ncbi:Phage tail tube protein, GTA-gp10 [Gemmobacter aquatilis]|uniref:Phage tail tube protein, GTA-gp10 n=1 Tax=Gemmobacter aquatilis TaxID=933059 RepID=A0A1H8P2U2_9RHOB|nr:gene transfer agent family protein [Gemmobacter aquatilis]SEO36081.1 Phage tail tube protein, GTA-gp10 [Gemmobacter aquatilis]
MTDLITHRAFFGDGEHAFTLTDPMLMELEKLTGLGAGALFFQMLALGYPAEYLREIIRLGLIGGGMAPEQAKRLCDTYAVNRPLAEVLGLAWEIMSARWNGKAEQGAA